MIPNDTFFPHVARFKVTLQAGGSKECKVTLLVPSKYCDEANADQRLKKLFSDQIQPSLAQNHADVLQKDFLPTIKIVYKPNTQLYEADLSTIPKSEQAHESTIADIQLISIEQFGIGETNNLDGSAAKLLPSIASLWPVYSKDIKGKNLEEKEFDKSAKHPEAFEELMAFFATALDTYQKAIQKPEEKAKIQPLVNQLKTSIELGKEKNLEKIVSVIMKESTKGPVTLPLGYFRGGNYIPLMLIFTRDDKNVLTLTTTALDPGLGTKARPFHRYSFTKDDSRVGNQIKVIIELLSRYKQRPERPHWKGAKKGLDQLDRKQILMAMHGGGEKKLIQTQARADAVKQFLEFLRLPSSKEKMLKVGLHQPMLEIVSEIIKTNKISSFGEEYSAFLHVNLPLDEEKGKEFKEKLEAIGKQLDDEVATIKRQMGEPTADFKADQRDVFTIIHTIIKNQEGVVPLALDRDLARTFKTHSDKLSGLFNWLYERDAQLTTEHQLRIETLILLEFGKVSLTGIEKQQYRPEDRVNILRFLADAFKDLSKKYQKEFGSTVALQRIWESDGVLNGLMSRIRKAIDQVEFEQHSVNFHNLYIKEIFPWEVTQEKELTRTTPKGHGNLVPYGVDQKPNLDILRLIDSDQPRPMHEVNAAMTQVLAACEKLYEGHEYGELLTAATITLSVMPKPQSKFWESLTVDQIREWSHHLTRLTEYMWESNLKQGNTYVWPQTAFALMKTRANLHKLVNVRIEKIKEHMIATYAALSPEHKQALAACLSEGGNLLTEYLSKTNCNILDGRNSLHLALHAAEAGELLKLSHEEVTLLLLVPFTIDTRQAIYLLTQHPYLRYSRDPILGKETMEIAEYFNEVSEHSFRHSGLNLYLDSARYVTERDSEYADFKFFDYLKYILSKSQTSKKIQNLGYLDLWCESWERNNPILPAQLVDWRRHFLYSQVILHPVSSLYKGFPVSTNLNEVERMKYVLEEQNKIQGEEAKDYNTLLKLMTESQAATVSKQIQELGPLKLTIGRDSERQLPAVNISDKNGNIHIFYQALGIDVYDFRNPYSNNPVIGDPLMVPQSILLSRTGQTDKIEDLSAKKLKEREQILETNQYATEPTIIKEEQSDLPTTSLGPEINARLRTLVVDRKAFKPSPNTFYNTMDFIFDYPYLLENELVQNLLNQVIYQTGVIQSVISNKEYFSDQLKKRFDDLIKNAINLDQIRTAIFLLQIGATINGYQELKIMPDFDSEYTKDGNQIRALDYYNKKAGDPKTEASLRKYIYTAVLNELYLLSKTKALTLSQRLTVFRGYAVIKHTAPSTGDLMLQKTLTDWVEQVVLSRFNRTPLDQDNKALLTALATDTELDRRHTTEWTEEPGKPFVFKSQAGVVIDLRHGLIQDIRQGDIGFPTKLPEAIAKHPDFLSLFDKPMEVLATTPPKGKNEYQCFTFIYKGKNFTLLYQPDKKELQIEQIIHKLPYRYIKMKGMQSIGNRRAENLIERYGIWKNDQIPNYAYLIPYPAGEWKDENLLTVTLDSYGRISEIKSRDHYVVINDAKQHFLTAFPFLDPSDVIVSRMSSNFYMINVRILSKGITFEQNPKTGIWEGKGDLKDFHFVIDKSKLHDINKTFGSYYSDYLLPFEKTDPISKVTTTQCQLFPVQFKRPMKESELSEFQSAKSIDSRVAAERDVVCLTVTAEVGRGDGDDGRLKSTSTGFFYLAYVSYFHGDYENAIRYLEKALETPFVVKERKAYEMIERFIREHKDTSVRGLAFRLKAELAMRAIRRDKMDIKEFAPHSWKSYLDKIREDVQLYQDYQKAMERQKGHRKDVLLGPLLKLSEDDVLAYNKLIKESFDFLVQLPPPPQPQKTPAVDFAIRPIETAMIEKFSNQLARYMAPGVNLDLHRLPVQMSMPQFLRNFWGFADVIIKEGQKGFDQSNIVPLLEGLNVSVLSPDDAAIVDVGRQLLISLAKMHEHNTVLASIYEEMNTKSISLTADQLTALTNANEELQKLMEQLKPPLVPQKVWDDVKKVVQSLDPNSTIISSYTIMTSGISRLVDSYILRITRGSETETLISVQKSLDILAEANKQFAEFQAILGFPQAVPVTNKFVTTIETIEKMSDIHNTDSIFTAEEKIFWGAYAKKMREEAKVNPTEPRPITDILNVFVQQKTPVPAMRHEYETIREIQNILKTLKVPYTAPAFRPEQNRLSPELLTELRNRPDLYIEEINKSFGSSSLKPSHETIAADIDSLLKPRNAELDPFIRHCQELFSANKDVLDKEIKSTSENLIPEKKGFLFFSSTKNVTTIWHFHVLSKVLAFYKERNLPVPNELTPFQNPDHLKANLKAFVALLERLEPVIEGESIFEKLNKQAAIIKTYYGRSPDPMEDAENARICKGLDDKVAAKRADLNSDILNKDVIEQDSGVLRSAGLKSLETFLTKRQSSLTELTEAKRQLLLNGLKLNVDFLRRTGKLNQRLNSLLAGDLASKGADWQAEIIDVALDLYKNNELRSEARLPEARIAALDKLEQTITDYLFLSTEQQQIRKALVTIRRNMQPLLVDGVVPENSQATWEEYSQALLSTLQGAGRQRYVTGDSLINPAYSRKHLVAEYRTEMIARKYQPQVVEKLVENPKRLILLRPGAGKSKWITPEAAQLIAKEKNKFTVVLVTDHLMDIYRTDTDKSTLEMFKQAGHIFDFNRNSPKDPSYLADEYRRLLQVQRDNGYVITTIGRMASVEDEIAILHKELKEKYDAFIHNSREGKYNPNDPKSHSQSKEDFLNLMYIQKQLHWMKKIRDLYRADSTAETKEVVFLADEVDAILDVNNDYNYSIEEKTRNSLRPPHETLTAVCHTIMTTISTSKKASLVELSKQLKINKQSTFNGKDEKGKAIIDPYLEDVAHEIWNDPKAFNLEGWNVLKQALASDENFVGFVTGQLEEPPKSLLRYVDEGMKKSGFDNLEDFLQKDPIRYVLALKHFLKQTLPIALIQEANTEFGLAENDCVVVPKKERTDLPGVRYGDEYDNVAFQYMYQATKVFSFDYFKEQWRKKEYQILSGLADPKWEVWYSVAMNTPVDGILIKDLPLEKRLLELYNMFKNSEVPYSVELRYALLAEDALPNHVKIFCAQAKCNSQDPLYDVTLGGASGTVSEYALPDSFERDESVYSREVMADTLLRLASMSPEGLGTEVQSIREPLKDLVAFATNPKNTYIVDLGAILEEYSTPETVVMLREGLKAAGKPRQLLFVVLDQVGDKQIRRQMMWNPADEAPKPFDKAELKPDAFFYYAPADIRGTDWPMQAGHGLLIPGANTLDDPFIQAVWRARRLGQGQTMEIRMHHAVVDALKKKLGKPDGKLTLGDMLKNIQKRTLSKTAGQNYKSRVKKIQAIVPQGIKKSFFTTHIKDELAYWNIGKEDPDVELRIFSDIAFDSHYFGIIQKYFIEERNVKFAQELKPTRDIEVMKAFELQTEAQKQAHSEMETRYSSIEPSIAEDIYVVARNARPGIQPGNFAHPLTLERLAAIRLSIHPLQNTLENNYSQLKTDQAHHLSNLNATVSSSVISGSEGSQEMVQAQEQAQQQQQQQVVALTAASGRDRLERKPADVLTWFNWKVTDNITGDGFPAIPIPGLDPSLNIKMTPNYKLLWDSIKTHHGELMGRIAISKDESGKQLIALIDNLDLDICYRPSIAYYKKKLIQSIKQDQKLTQSIAIYSLSKTPPPSQTGLIFIEGTDNLVTAPLALVLIKLMSGQVLFNTPEEEVALASWIRSHPDVPALKSFLCRTHNVDLITQIPAWEKSPLSKLLSADR